MIKINMPCCAQDKHMFTLKVKNIRIYQESGFPQKFKNTIPWFFHDQQCNFNDFLMYGLQPAPLAASSPQTRNAEKLMYLKKHTCRRWPCRALTRILKTGVPEPSLPKSGSPTIQKNIASFKNRSPCTKNGSSGLQINSYWGLLCMHSEIIITWNHQ